MKRAPNCFFPIYSCPSYPIFDISYLERKTLIPVFSQALLLVYILIMSHTRFFRVNLHSVVA